MTERNVEIPADCRIEFRVGINVGDIIIDGDDIYGDGVNVAARLAEPSHARRQSHKQRDTMQPQAVAARRSATRDPPGLH
jgi:class 3 adenylate cyclase